MCTGTVKSPNANVDVQLSNIHTVYWYKFLFQYPNTFLVDRYNIVLRIIIKNLTSIIGRLGIFGNSSHHETLNHQITISKSTAACH